MTLSHSPACHKACGHLGRHHNTEAGTEQPWECSSQTAAECLTAPKIQASYFKADCAAAGTHPEKQHHPGGEGKGKELSHFCEGLSSKCRIHTLKYLKRGQKCMGLHVVDFSAGYTGTASSIRWWRLKHDLSFLQREEEEGARRSMCGKVRFELVQLGQRKKVNRRNQGWHSARGSTKSFWGLFCGGQKENMPVRSCQGTASTPGLEF